MTSDEPRLTSLPPADPGLRGSLRDDDVADAVRKGAPLFRACTLHGSAVVRVVVDTDGHVRSVSLYRDHLRDPSTGSCLLRAIQQIPFPVPDEPAEVIIPFAFR